MLPGAFYYSVIGAPKPICAILAPSNSPEPEGMPLALNRLFLLLLICASPIGLSAHVSAQEPLRIAVISDINGRYGSTAYHDRVAQAIERIILMGPDLVISTGDMVAGQRPSPRLSGIELDSMWRHFHESVRKPLENAGIPVLMTPGNHDASAYPAYSLERDRYSAYHSAHPPTLEVLDPGHFPFRYAVTVGDVLLVSLDATTIGPVSAAQREWLAGLLDARDRYRSVFVFGHLPLQPVAVGREREIIVDPVLEKLMAAGEVSAYLSGHHHAFYPGWRNGLSMLSMGNLGGNPRALTGTNNNTGFSFVWLVVHRDGSYTIDALTEPDFDTRIPLDSLPPSLGNGKGQLSRLDLAIGAGNDK